MMNVTGVVLEVGQRLEVRIIDEAKEKAELQQKNEQFLRTLIQQLIDEELNTDDDEELEDEDQDDNLEDDTDWDSWFQPLIEDEPPEPLIFNFTKNRYAPRMIEIPKLYSYKHTDTDRDPGYEYRMLVKKWKENDPLRWQLVEEHNRIPTEHSWNAKRFNPGERVELYWFLDEMPGYAYLKGKKGTVIRITNSYVIVHFDGMNEQQQMIPGVLNKISGDNKLPKLIDIDLIQTERLGTGWTAWVAGYKTTWDFGMTKNDAIHKLLQTWYWNIKHQ